MNLSKRSVDKELLSRMSMKDYTMNLSKRNVIRQMQYFIYNKLIFQKINLWVSYTFYLL